MTPADVTVSLGVGENPAKRIADPFERDLLAQLPPNTNMRQLFFLDNGVDCTDTHPEDMRCFLNVEQARQIDEGRNYDQLLFLLLGHLARNPSESKDRTPLDSRPALWEGFASLLRSPCRILSGTEVRLRAT